MSNVFTKTLLSIVIMGLLFYAMPAAKAAEPNVTEEQKKLKGAIEKTKSPVETFKDLAPSAGFLKPDKNAPPGATSNTDTQQKAGSAQQPYQPEPLDYMHLGKRDPFVPLIKQETDKKKGGSPMENFMVTDIKVVGILVKNAQYFAQIVLPDGKSYTIKTGQKLGLMGGIVSDINNDGVIIKEKGLDAEGKPTVKNITLRLRKEEEE